MDSVTLLERGGDTPMGTAATWTVVAHSGPGAVTTPDAADVGGARRQGPAPRPGRPHAHRGRPPGARGVRRLRGRGAGAAAAGRRGRGGPADRRGGPDAHRAAHRGQPRPAHPARLGEGGGDQPALPRYHLERGRPRRTAGHRGRVAGQADPAGRQPAGHEQAAGGGAGGVLPADRPGGGRGGRARPARPGQPGGDRGHSRVAARGAGGPGDPGTRDRRTSPATRCATPRPASRRCWPPARSATGWNCAWWTGGPASRPTTGTASSCRSSGSATPTTPPGWAWAWPCPAASPR